MTRTTSTSLPPRVPYPQTPQTARAWIVARGISLADFARYHDVPRSTLVDLLRGRQKGHRGLAYKGAVLLGLKPQPKVPA